MAQFTVNTHRFDPYKNFKFRVKWDGALRRRHQQGRRAEADDRGRRAPRGRRSQHQPQDRPGRTKYEPITLERGVTHDLDFEQWANKVWDYGTPGAADSAQEVSLKDFRKDIIIDMFNEAGQKVLSYHVYRCWVSEYQALPELDANANAVAIQTIKLENEGWDRIRR